MTPNKSFNLFYVFGKAKFTNLVTWLNCNCNCKIRVLPKVLPLLDWHLCCQTITQWLHLMPNLYWRPQRMIQVEHFFLSAHTQDVGPILEVGNHIFMHQLEHNMSIFLLLSPMHCKKILFFIYQSIDDVTKAYILFTLRSNQT